MSKIRVENVEVATPEDEALRKWLAEQRLKSVDNLEAAARQIITLVTALLGVLFTVLAVTNDPLPSYMRLPLMRGLGIGCVVGLCLALIFALLVVLPFAYGHFPYRTDIQQSVYAQMLGRKATFLTWAGAFFFLGLLALGLVLVGALAN